MPVAIDPAAQPMAQRGAVLPMFAILIVVMLGAAGLAVDLGWLYFQSVEVQHGADMAALAGVVYEPLRREEAHAEALASAAENGFVDASLGGRDSVLIEDVIDNQDAVEHGSQLRATITHSTPTFFMKIFGIGQIDLTRTAVAQYILPLAMGSPDATFGNDPATGHEPGLWASIHGTFVPQGWGDRYAALCLGTDSFAGDCVPTAEGRPSLRPGTEAAIGGYVYGIEVGPDAGGLTVEIFDGPYYHYEDEVPVAGENSTLYWTGDFAAAADQVTWFMLYGPDVTPLDTTDGNELLCVVRYGARESRAEDFTWWDDSWTGYEEIDTARLGQMWDSMATSPDRFGECDANFDRGPGIYPLRVMVEHNDSTWVTNKYSLRTSTTSGPTPKIYGLADMSIFINVDAEDDEDRRSMFYLARVEDRYAGGTLIVELWDPGDVDAGGGKDRVTISSGHGSTLNCSWAASGGAGDTSCSVEVTAGLYDNQLITVTIPIPGTYSCSGDACWFRVTYQYTGDRIHDTTTWSAFIAGNPIRLVE